MSSKQHPDNCVCNFCNPQVNEKFGKLDHKYVGIVFKATDLVNPIPQDEWIMFRAKDNALLDTLLFYLNKCEELGANQEHIDALTDLIGRVKTWRRNNLTDCKTPDTYDNELLFDALDERTMIGKGDERCGACGSSQVQGVFVSTEHDKPRVNLCDICARTAHLNGYTRETADGS